MRTEQTRPQNPAAGRSAPLYDLLGVSPDASMDAIKRAYRRRARELHPDANPGDPSSARRFDQVTSAYETLADPVRRAHYDRWAGVSLPRDRPRARRSRSNIFATDEPAGRSGTDGYRATAGGADDAGGSTGHRDHRTTRRDRDPVDDPETAAAPTGDAPPRARRDHALDLPVGMANRLTAGLLVAPLLWALLGFPGTGDRTLGAVTSWWGALALGITLVIWFLVSSLLWARSPSVPRQLSPWRSPGWDGTPLLIRVALLLALGGLATATLLGAEPDGTAELSPGWRLLAWGVAMVLVWVLSGQIPSRIGYRSRHDRYWGRPGATLRPRR